MISIHQTVRVTQDVPEHQVTRGMVGAVIEVFEVPRRAYEIELVDSEGRTVLQATLTEDILEAI